MHNKVKNIIVLGIAILVLSTLTVTAALVTSANNITFSSDKTEKTNVEDALDELYDLQTKNTITTNNLLPENIKEGITVSVSNGNEDLFSVTGTLKDAEPYFVAIPELNEYFYCSGASTPVAGGVLSFSSYLSYSSSSDGSFTIFKPGKYRITVYLTPGGAMGSGTMTVTATVNGEKVVSIAKNLYQGVSGAVSNYIDMDLNTGDIIKFTATWNGSGYFYWGSGDTGVKHIED